MEKISNNYLKELVKLKQKKYREISKKVIVEGYRTIKQIHLNGITIEELYISKSASYDTGCFKPKNIFLFEDWQFERISSTKSPSQISALIRAETRQIKNREFLLYLDNIKEPGNLGAIVRTAAAAGISGVVLSPDCCEIFNPKVIKASSGTVFSVPIEKKDYKWLKIQKSVIITTTMEDSISLFKLKKPDKNIILVLGSEAFGISKEILEISDIRIKIPLTDKIESLNVAVAAGIAIYYLIDK
jgi:TrmH family RNA methyltransferase